MENKSESKDRRISFQMKKKGASISIRLRLPDSVNDLKHCLHVNGYSPE